MADPPKQQQIFDPSIIYSEHFRITTGPEFIASFIELSNSAFVREWLDMLSATNARMENAVCPGLGTNLTIKNTYGSWQLAFFLLTARHLSKDTDVPIKSYARDPAFTLEDAELLKALGIEILKEDNEIHEIITSSTFLFMPSLPIHIMCATLTNSKPALYVGNPMSWTLCSLARHITNMRAINEYTGHIGHIRVTLLT